MTPRRLNELDLPAAVALLERVGLAGGALNLARYMHWQPDGVWAIDRHSAPARPGSGGTCDRDHTLAGIATVLRHGAVGFVGCMAIEPALQGAGIGRCLLEHAQREAARAGVTTFLLEATPAGALLYRRLGYVEDYETAMLARTANGAADAARIAPAEHAAVLALDRVASGTPRDAMIGGLVAEAPGAVVVAGGELAGYGLVVGDRLGPVIARTPAAGRALIDRLVAPTAAACVPLPNLAAIEALAARGFTEVRRLSRMRLGPAVPIHVDWIWALASPGAG